MPSSFSPRTVALVAAVALAAGAQPVLAAGPVSVTVNGSQINLSPPPTTRAGRVFVPLRGVFENLGATVVYSAGVINATGRGHSVSLKIGSQQATVDGQQQTVDVAPFLIGASTYVPLRFVSQALGATVNYDGSNNLVAINTNGQTQTAQNPPAQTLTPAPGSGGEPFGAITLASVLPARGSASSNRPLIEATFAGGTVDPNATRVTLDGADITSGSTRSPRGFTYAPQSPLQAESHRVVVSGTDTSGAHFRRGWSFTSGSSSAGIGQITDVRPANGAAVGNQFVVSGRTTPGAKVTVQVGASSGNTQTIGGIIGAILGGGGQGNSASYTLSADGNGAFSTQVNIAAAGGSALLLVINANDPQTGAAIANPIQEQLTVK